MGQQTAETIDLDMLAADLAKMLDRYGYPLDVAESHIRPELESFVAAIQANAAADGDLGEDAAAWSPATEEPDLPTIQTGRPPAMTYTPWWRSQTVDLGATARDEWYWRCPKRGCRVWAGPYPTPANAPGEAKKVGMNHVYREHDLPAARAGAERRSARKSR